MLIFLRFSFHFLTQGESDDIVTFTHTVSHTVPSPMHNGNDNQVNDVILPNTHVPMLLHCCLWFLLGLACHALHVTSLNSIFSGILWMPIEHDEIQIVPLMCQIWWDLNSNSSTVVFFKIVFKVSKTDWSKCFLAHF